MQERYRKTTTRLTLNEWLMKPKSIRVILIDPFKRSIEERHMDGTLDSIYDLIGCELFEPIRLDGLTQFLVDEEGALTGRASVDGIKHGFVVKGLKFLIYGRALVVGATNKKGDMTSTPFSEDGVRQMITHWFTYDEKQADGD